MVFEISHWPATQTAQYRFHCHVCRTIGRWWPSHGEAVGESHDHEHQERPQ